jgi:hypothetical protein
MEGPMSSQRPDDNQSRRDPGDTPIKPEYEEDHPAPPPLPADPILVEDLRPDVEGETIPERNRREAEGGDATSG